MGVGMIRTSVLVAAEIHNLDAAATEIAVAGARIGVAAKG